MSEPRPGALSGLRVLDASILFAGPLAATLLGDFCARPAFGTLAEAISGFAAMTREPGGPPTLPPFGLADGIAGIATALAVMTALHARRAGRWPDGHRCARPPIGSNRTMVGQ